MSGDPYVLVVSLHPQDVFTSLFFTNALAAPSPIRVVQYRRGDLGAAIAGASAVVVIRGLFEFADVIAAAGAMRIPVFYFIDDNFMVLRDFAGPHAKFVHQYSMDAVREALRQVSGVLVSSPALLEYFSANALHRRVWLFPPAAARRIVASAPVQTTAIRAAFFGGLHLHDTFLNRVMPALRRLALERRVALTTIGMPRIEAGDRLPVTTRFYDVSYGNALNALAADGVDLFLHPVADDTPNNRYKIPHALISAHAINAIPVVSNLPPYDALGAEVAMLADNSESSWYDALARAAETNRATFADRLSAYCATRFSGQRNRDAIAEILSESRPPSSAEVRRRRALGGLFMLRRFGARVVRRLRATAGSGGSIA